MEVQTKAYQTFEDLDAYKAAREFRKAMYAVTRQLPDFEKFELASQIRRAAVSLTDNIAEGHGRFHYLDQIKFMLHSRGSLEELQDDLNVCEDEKYLPAPDIARLKDDAWRVHKILNGYIRYLRGRKASEPYVLRDEKRPDDFSADELNELLTASTL
ncbi:MAG: four helix bundle protein [Verrucomicrobiales bacterium]|nr:four helix bundle protein [Verrucomicrobiales bacterium]